jgi:hypothetical protein
MNGENTVERETLVLVTAEGGPVSNTWHSDGRGRRKSAAPEYVQPVAGAACFVLVALARHVTVRQARVRVGPMEGIVAI